MTAHFTIVDSPEGIIGIETTESNESTESTESEQDEQPVDETVVRGGHPYIEGGPSRGSRISGRSQFCLAAIGFFRKVCNFGYDTHIESSAFRPNTRYD